ncbi:MAG TPA: membrane-bound lytic murein transglycosylase MltF [bacterium]|nr:membrane-bound lytic murein transglycosylase MltF [bacterium]
MNKKIISWITGSLVIIISAIIFSGHQTSQLETIKKTDTLRILTDNNFNCYYLYRNRPMGFEYDLARSFADYLGVELKVINPDWNEMFSSLHNNKGDIIAANLTITDNRKEHVDFSRGYLAVQQHIIKHYDNRSVETMEDLNGKKIHIREGTSYHQRLKELKSRGLDVELVLYKDLPTEEFIRMVADKEIELTVSDSHIARLNRRYYPEIRISVPIEEKQWLGWAVEEGNHDLRDAINDFFKKIKDNGQFGKIYEKYFANIEIFDYVDIIKFHQRVRSRLPKYKSLIQNQAQKYDFDWRLIAAIIYQESHYNPRARSFTGVKGLMQVTLRTAREMGIRNRLDPVQSIKGGIKYLNKIYQRFDNIEGLDRMKFTMASYNIGYGHVRDAQKIAQEKGLEPTKWSSLEQTLPLLRYRKYYKDTKYGYARGTEPVRYVNRVMTYYDILRQKSIS